MLGIGDTMLNFDFETYNNKYVDEQLLDLYRGKIEKIKEKLPFYSIVGCLFFTFIVGFCAIFFDLKSISYKEYRCTFCP